MVATLLRPVGIDVSSAWRGKPPSPSCSPCSARSWRCWHSPLASLTSIFGLNSSSASSRCSFFTRRRSFGGGCGLFHVILRRKAMTQYQGNVQSYVLEIQSPNSPYNQKGVISLHGAFGMAILYFVRRMGNSERTKNALGVTFTISIIGWIPGRISPTCSATRSRCNSSTTILTTRLKSEAFALPFLVGQSVSPTGSSKPIFFHDKIAKIYNQPCTALCRPIRDRDRSRPPRRLASKFILNGSPAPPR
jgi:hypothetical protein